MEEAATLSPDLKDAYELTTISGVIVSELPRKEDGNLAGKSANFEAAGVEEDGQEVVWINIKSIFNLI